MRRYETIFILRPNTGEDEITRIIESTTQIILDEKGTIIEMARWGMKKLAYLIKKESLGYYVFCDYAATPAAVAEIERKFRIDDVVLKYLTIKTAKSITEETIQDALKEISEKEAALLESESSEDDDSEGETEAETEAVPQSTEESKTE